jgi:polar amino acid transport system ATP-binding protein
MMTPMISLDAVGKSFGRFRALDGISGEINRGEVVVICGPSGSGKSTLIRCLNGLEPIDQGRITIDNVDLSARDTDLKKLRRRIGFVFQQYNLFPHLNAVDNVSIGLRRLMHVPAPEAHARALSLLERVGLDHRATYMPVDLSGGEQQRVAIARALSMSPPIMLLDEPTSALDPEVVGEVLAIMQSLSGTGMTIVCVTHEMGFARTVGNWIWFMEAGSIVEKARPETFFSNPLHPSAERFVSTIRSSHARA